MDGSVGAVDGAKDGEYVGAVDGIDVGEKDGASVGASVGDCGQVPIHFVSYADANSIGP